MARIKIVMGFLILAAMLKYFSNIDQVMQWNFLTRERFLAAWVVLFALPGLYLLGFLRMEGIKADERVGAGRLLAAGLLLAFSVSLLPGMFGTRLGEIEAYIPAPVENAASGLKWMKNQYEDALAQAKAENKLVFVNFTGYACTNCHWMKANMFPRPEVKEALKDLVLVELYTDGTDAVSEKNQQRQEEMFKSVAIPFYALLSPDGKVVASFAGLTKDPAQFVQFLKTRPAA
jgi:thiol:disulfide interchange protein